MSNTPFKSSTHDILRTKKTADEILADIIHTPITCQSLLDSCDKGVIAQTDISGYHLLPISGKKIHDHLNFTYAQTIAWMPATSGLYTPTYNYDKYNLNPLGINVNHVIGYFATSDLVNDIPDLNTYYQKLNLWSITTGQNDGYDYTLSYPNAYDVLRHGFRVKQTGYFKVNGTLHLKSYVSGGRYNVAFQYGTRSGGENDTTESTLENELEQLQIAVDAAIANHDGSPESLANISQLQSDTDAKQAALKSYIDNTWTRVDIPQMTGYLNLHSSGRKMNTSFNISTILYLNAGDEVALFSAGFASTSAGTVRALIKQSSFSIQKM